MECHREAYGSHGAILIDYTVLVEAKPETMIGDVQSSSDSYVQIHCWFVLFATDFRVACTPQIQIR